MGERMVVTRTPAVVPDNLNSILMVIAVSACGFAAQVGRIYGTTRHDSLTVLCFHR